MLWWEWFTNGTKQTQTFVKPIPNVLEKKRSEKISAPSSKVQCLIQN